MYTSGQFAGMFRVSKKLLRHYNDIGLLTPSEVNETNGYYYYDQISCEKMKRIMYLRSLNFSLERITAMLELSEEKRDEILYHHLMKIRAEQRVNARIETEFNIHVFHLDAPINVIGRAVRVVHGSPEHMSSVKSLIENFFGDDVSSMIFNKREPVLRFGICAEHNPSTGEFTYMMGDQTLQDSENMKIPETTRSYVIPVGDYACVTFSAPDVETITNATLEEGFDHLFGWLGSSEEWESSVLGVAYEVYDNERFEVPSWPEMEIWTPVKRK